jgi:hypothetical protein
MCLIPAATPRICALQKTLLNGSCQCFVNQNSFQLTNAYPTSL